jgi:hypothetical protein
MRELRNIHYILVGKPERKSPRDGHRRTWKEHIKIGLKQIVCEAGNWIQMVQYRIL